MASLSLHILIPHGEMGLIEKTKDSLDSIAQNLQFDHITDQQFKSVTRVANGNLQKIPGNVKPN